MNRALFFIVFFLIGALSSCIDRYFVENEIDFQPSLVIEGTITDENEMQEIIISNSIGLDKIDYEGVSGCKVTVLDYVGNEFVFFESFKIGHYLGNIPQEFLVPGNSFKIVVIKDGVNYESDFEELLACSEVDSVYYELQIDSYENNNLKAQTGLQFFVDVKVEETSSKFYRWKMEETYEFHTTWPIQKYWAGKWVQVFPDYSYSVCYNTNMVYGIYAVSTENVMDTYLKYPLHFVDNTTQRLYYKYSLLCKQYSLTARAYNYWQLLSENSQESGGLFDKQPVNIQGNIFCVDNPNIKVLGYFGVSSVKAKRIFIDKPSELKFTDDLFCGRSWVEVPFIIVTSTPDEWPFYIAPPPEDDELGGYYYAPSYCFDCRDAGGVIEKPPFWDQE